MKKNLVITLLMATVAATVFVGCGKKDTVVVSSEAVEIAEQSEYTDVFEINTEADFVNITEGEPTVDGVKPEDTEGETEETTEVVSTDNKETSNSSETAKNENSTKIESTTSDNKDASTNSENTTTSDKNSTSNESTELSSSLETPTPEPSPEPVLESFPYALNTIYDNGDGTGCIYVIDQRYRDPDAWEAQWSSWGPGGYAIYYGEQLKKIGDMGAVPNTFESLGEYQEGFIKKITYVPNPYI